MKQQLALLPSLPCKNSICLCSKVSLEIGANNETQKYSHPKCW